MDNYDVLRNDLIKGKLKEKQWLDLEKRVREFVAGDNPQSEKDELGKYAEMLYMACRAVEQKRGENNGQNSNLL